jgi:hypothetical protein
MTMETPEIERPSCRPGPGATVSPIDLRGVSAIAEIQNKARIWMEAGVV